MDNSNTAQTDTNAATADDTTLVDEGGTGQTADQTANQSTDQTTDQTTDQANDKPVEYSDFTLPEGQKLDEYSEMVNLAKELGLDQDKAQKLIDYEAGQRKMASEGSQSNAKILAEQRKSKWLDAAQKDTEIGGAKLMNEHIPNAEKLLNRFGTAAGKEFLVDNGFVYHPEVVRMFSRIAQQFSEDTFHTPGDESGGKEKTPAERLYGKAG